MSTADRDAVFDYASFHYKALSRTEISAIVFDGDSITFGTGAAPDEYDYSYPSQLARLAATAPKVENSGAAGAAIQNNTAATKATTFLANNAAYTNRIVVGLWGHNDINGGRNAGQITADIDTYIASIRAADAGAIVIGLTILPSTNFSGPEPGRRGNVNTHILTTANFDFTVDIASNINLTDPNDATYYADGIHLTDAGNAELASDVFDVLVAQSYLS